LEHIVGSKNDNNQKFMKRVRTHFKKTTAVYDCMKYFLRPELKTIANGSTSLLEGMLSVRPYERWDAHDLKNNTHLFTTMTSSANVKRCPYPWPTCGDLCLVSGPRSDELPSECFRQQSGSPDPVRATM
jgi:hypothetical protein